MKTDNDANDQQPNPVHRPSHMENELSYFEVAPTSHDSSISLQNHTMKQRGKASPPSNSGTTSASTGTPSSYGGVSSGDYLHIKRTTPSPPLPRHTDTSQADQTWSAAVPDYPPPPLEHLPQLAGKKCSSSTYPSAIKLLVSNNVAGSIIGRAGQTISEMQTQSSARIKLSQTGDYYPGTQDRVCLVQGKLETVKSAIGILLKRFHKLQEQQHSQQVSCFPQKGEDDGQKTEFEFIVRLLVPSSCCGMIIGKGGANIKRMEETSGVSSIRLSPKDTPDQSPSAASVVAGTLERVVTLTGPSLESCLDCLCSVIDCMTMHQDISRYTNMTTSYTRVVHPTSFNPTTPAGRPVLLNPGEGVVWEGSEQFGPFVPGRSNSSPDLLGQMIWDQRGHLQRLPNESPRGEPLQHYNSFFEGPPTYTHEMTPIMPPQIRGPPGDTGSTSMYLPSPPALNQIDDTALQHSSSSPDVASQLRDSLQISSSLPQTPASYAQFPHQMPQQTPHGFTAQILVPDTMIGSILGRGGRTLNELQVHSNTRIRISQRGEYMPGTRNRIVTIRGPTSQSVSFAQHLINQQMVLPPTANFSQAGLYPSHATPQQGQLSLVPPPLPSHQYDANQTLYATTQEHASNPAHNIQQGHAKPDSP
ncbi:unnamed protein product [Cylindrotheca closterium]|uniref:K Homology domain-containing protein n=1 Tax=Cylindrotheca closterium TaxID=2856 RepID=A0AAD2FUF8_9STRA|nr:unnamed protein product [Cylindrotheca closterium]